MSRPQLMPFARVTVAMSLSESDTALLEYARLLTQLGCADFKFVHVAAPSQTPGDTARAIQDRIEAEVERHFRNEAAAVRCSCHVLQGVRIDGLIQFSAEAKADLIVLGHRKARSGARSLARRLAMIAPCSVWLVPEGATVRLSSILVPIDFSEHSADALSVATDIAARQGLPELRTLHVFFDPSTVRYDEHLDEVLGSEEAKFAEFIKPVNRHGVRIECLYSESTHPAQEILRKAERVGADLIVMNTRGRSRAAAILLGSITSEVMQETRVPILVVKHWGAKLSMLQALFDARTWTAETPKAN